MKKAIWFILMLAFTALISACSSEKPTASEKIKTNVTEKVHALDADERPRASANAKTYFEKEFPVIISGDRRMERGVFLECRPSDSNFNGLVTCKGQVPQLQGGFKEVTRYCGYTPELVGCSDEDTVAK